jgi:hypothetical protein
MLQTLADFPEAVGVSVIHITKRCAA